VLLVECENTQKYILKGIRKIDSALNCETKIEEIGANENPRDSLPAIQKDYQNENTKKCKRKFSSFGFVKKNSFLCEREKNIWIKLTVKAILRVIIIFKWTVKM